MKDNTGMISKKKMIESIRTGIRAQVVSNYSSWASGFADKAEFENMMWDTRTTAEYIVESLGNMDLLSDDEALDLCKFIHGLTETY